MIGNNTAITITSTTPPITTIISGSSNAVIPIARRSISRDKVCAARSSIGGNAPLRSPEMAETGRTEFTGLKISVFLEVEGAAHYLPAYAGNLDIMTSAALRTAEHMAARMLADVVA